MKISFLNLKSYLLENKLTIVFIFLWLLSWGGYNTGIERVLSENFPVSIFDFVHGVRAFLPITAGVISLGIIFYKGDSFNKKFFMSPLGLLLIYSIVGIFSSLFSDKAIVSLYWALMFFSVVLAICLVYFSKDRIKNIIIINKFNWIIAGILSVILLSLFFLQSGINPISSPKLLICSQRPFESLGAVRAAKSFLGMAGTRPTGLGRYIGIATLAIFALALYSINKKIKTYWYVLFSVFLSALFFTKARADLGAFSVAISSIFLISKKIKSYLVILLIAILLLSAFFILYRIPCQDGDLSNLKKSVSEDGIVSTIIFDTSIKNQSVTTLSGRTKGVWFDAIRLFKQFPLIGKGFQADRIFLDGQHTHNTALHTLIQVGIIGAIAFGLSIIITLIFLVKLSIRFIREKRFDWFFISAMSIFTFILIRGITESFAFYSADFLFILPIILYIQLLHRKYSNE